MKKKELQKRIMVIITSLVLLLSCTTTIYAIKYTELEPNAFPGVDTSNTQDLGAFLGQIFNFGIAIAVTLALVMIIWGGIIKMTTDSWSKTDEANKKIQNAVYGLVLALVSWLLLYTINPDMVTFDNNTFLGTEKNQTK